MGLCLRQRAGVCRAGGAFRSRLRHGCQRAADRTGGAASEDRLRRVPGGAHFIRRRFLRPSLGGPSRPLVRLRRLLRRDDPDWARQRRSGAGRLRTASGNA